MRVMKNSGIDWINIVPNSWNTTRLKSVLVERNEKNSPIKTTNLLSLSIERGVFPYSEKTGGGNKAKENFEDYKLTHVNDIVLNSMNVVVGAVGISKYYGCVSPVYYTLYSRNNELYNINYYNYIFQSEVFQKSLWGLGNGIVVKESDNGKLNTIRMRIPMEKLNGVILPVPPIKEQEEIANFLDEKTQEIDNAIEKTKKTIEDYKKLKEKVITDAVTKGLNKTLKMKTSNVDWIGTIPATSYVTRLKYLVEAIKDGTHGTHERVNEGRCLLSAKNIENGKILISDKESFISEEDYKKIVSNGFPRKNDILMCCVGDVGKTTIYDYDYPIAFQRSVMFIRIKPNFNYKYINYYLKSSSAKIEELLLVNKNIQAGLYQGAVAELRIVCHEPQVEKEIVNYLDSKCSEIDSLIKSKEKIVEELEKYKKSVIYEYVTGKKEVK